MFRELKERMKILAHNTGPKVFAASYTPRYFYPYRLQHSERISQPVRNNTFELVMDSKYDDEEITNERLIAKANEFRPDLIVPKDYPDDPEQTIASARSFMKMVEDLEYDPEVIPVLQPPYVESYLAHEGFLSEFSYLALGGLLSFDCAREQVAVIRQIRDVVGPNQYLHGFGVGTSLEMIRALRDEHLLTSLDISTAETALFGEDPQLPDKTWSQVSFQFPSGADSSTIRAQYSQATLLMLNYMLSDLVDDSVLEREYQRTVLPEVTETLAEKQARARAFREHPAPDADVAGEGSETAPTSVATGDSASDSHDHLTAEADPDSTTATTLGEF